MPETNSLLLNLAEWMDRRLRVTAQLQGHAPVLESMHHAIDCALPDRALELADAADPELIGVAELDWVRCRALWESARWDEVRALAGSIPPELSGDPCAQRIRMRAAWADLLGARLDGEHLAAVELLRPMILEQGSLAHTADLAHLDAYRALVFDDDLPKASGRAQLAASLYAHVGERGSEIKCRILNVRILVIEGQLGAAADEARRCVAAARSAGHPLLLIQALNADATVAWRQGDWDRSDSGFLAAERLAEEFEETRWRVAVQANRARLLAFRGRIDEAEALLGQIGTDGEPDTCTVAAIVEEYRGQIALLKGDAHEALEHYDKCHARLVHDGVQSYERAQVLLRKGEALVVLEEYAAAEQCLTEGIERLAGYSHALERGHLLHQRALCRVNRGRPEMAREDFGRAVAELRRVGDRWTLLRCLLDRAGSGLGPDEQCVSDATEARALATLLGHEDLAARARLELARADARLHCTGPVDDVPTPGGMIAVGPAMRAVVTEARLVATGDQPVLLQGETGTGKDVFARFVHENSVRRDARCVAVNCAAIPESLFEREFFGHARGAFTGAHREGRGLVEEAAGGTLFLDEVGELPLSLQPKLLRLLQDGSYRRVGDTQDRKVELRILSATNRPLPEAIRAGRFREDLYYRLRGFELALPPLRDRSEDLVPLAWAFLRHHADGAEAGIEPAAWRALRAYPWPGNVRELESVIGAAWVRARATGVIREEHLPSALLRRDLPVSGGRLDLSRAVRRTERELILEALGRAGFRRTDAAALLGIGRNTLYEKMKRLGISPQPAGQAAS